MYMKTCTHYSTRKLLAIYKVFMFLIVIYELTLYSTFCGDHIFVDYVRFLMHDNFWSLYAWCLRYNIFVVPGF